MVEPVELRRRRDHLRPHEPPREAEGVGAGEAGGPPCKAWEEVETADEETDVPEGGDGLGRGPVVAEGSRPRPRDGDQRVVACNSINQSIQIAVIQEVDYI